MRRFILRIISGAEFAHAKWIGKDFSVALYRDAERGIGYFRWLKPFDWVQRSLSHFSMGAIYARLRIGKFALSRVTSRTYVPNS
jgi:hypothetical protein